MHWTPQLQAFIAAHSADDTSRLLLSANRYPGIDVPFAAEQIEGRRRLQGKLPEWVARPDVIVPGRLPAEQCSSEQTARYKRRLCVGDTLIDLTGGMGVDFWYMSRGMARAVYVERNAMLCDTARHNFAALSAGADTPAIDVINADGIEHIASLTTADAARTTIYIDPARRAADGSRVYDLASCEPDVVGAQDILRAACARLVIKASPMADVSRLLALVQRVDEVHVVGVRGECKEVLLVVRGDAAADTTPADTAVHCTDFTAGGELTFSFRWDDEATAPVTLADGVRSYLYEPDATVLKAGAFRSIAARYGLAKLDVSTHLYTSDSLVDGFAGKTFAVDATAPLTSHTLKSLRRDTPRADITVRNAPLSVAELRRRTGIADGGDAHLFAATVHGIGAQIIRCRRLLAVLCTMLLLFAQALARTDADLPSLATLLRDVTDPPPIRWEGGRQFVYTAPSVNVALMPDDGAIPADVTPDDIAGSRWTFIDIVAEENWLGQTTTALRFAAPWGGRYRFDTGRSPQSVADTTYIPHIAGLYPLDVIQSVDSVLRHRTLYLMIGDERVLPADSIAASRVVDKFVPVAIDSVTWGDDVTPLRVACHRLAADGTRLRYIIPTTLPAERDTRVATPIDRVFSTTDPRDDHPYVSDEMWREVQRGHVVPDMTADEVRLAVGRPASVERRATRSGVVEQWSYRTGLIVVLLDGRVIHR